jgi:hypothetical protein
VGVAPARDGEIDHTARFYRWDRGRGSGRGIGGALTAADMGETAPQDRLGYSCSAADVRAAKGRDLMLTLEAESRGQHFAEVGARQ